MALKYIHEVLVEFDVPVTSVMAMYADGTWVMPNEFLTLESHPYKYGYGICSHSGYHILDFVAQIMLTGHEYNVKHEDFIAHSNIVRPSDFLKQIPEAQYNTYFPDYVTIKEDYESLMEKFSTFGELDAHCEFQFLKEGAIATQATVVLNHNSFSRRTWPVSKADLYKGNGRVKQQQFVIHQGPLQSIHIHNYQSNDKHDIDNTYEFEVGQNNHFDVYVFRNAGMFSKQQAFIKHDANDIYPNRGNRLSVEDAKFAILDEAIAFAQGKLNHDQLLSELKSHDLSVQMLSSVYLSMCSGGIYNRKRIVSNIFD